MMKIKFTLDASSGDVRVQKTIEVDEATTGMVNNAEAWLAKQLNKTCDIPESTKPMAESLRADTNGPKNKFARRKSKG